MSSIKCPIHLLDGHSFSRVNTFSFTAMCCISFSAVSSRRPPNRLITIGLFQLVNPSISGALSSN